MQNEGILLEQSALFDTGGGTASLKREIARCWPEQRERAFQLYDRLLAAEEKRLGNKVVDRQAISELAERAVHTGQWEAEMLADASSRTAAGYLKECVDKYRWQDNEQAIRYAKALIQLGELRSDNGQQGLGMMALGDSLAIKGKNLAKAGKWQQAAAALFLKEGDLIGWSRTIIGRVAICVEMHCNESALNDAELALSTFKRYGCHEFFIRLTLSIMRALGELGQYRETLRFFEKALPVAAGSGAGGEELLGMLYINAGTSYVNLGEFGEACNCFAKAREIVTRLHKTELLDHILDSTAQIESTRGNYREALVLWNKLLDRPRETPTIHSLQFRKGIVECYLNLNRDREARDEAQALVEDIGKMEEQPLILLAHALRCLGIAHARLGAWPQAEQCLLQARFWYSSLKSRNWIWMNELCRCKILIAEGNYRRALKRAQQAAAFFRKKQQPLNWAYACQSQAECFIGLGWYRKAARKGRELLRTGSSRQVSHFLYYGHWLLGKAKAAAGALPEAIRHYQQSMEILEQLQKNLTLTIRPGFLEDKCEAGYELVHLYLRGHRTEEACETLERIKSLTMRSSLLNRKQLFWSDTAPQSSTLIEELGRMRSEYTALTRLELEKGTLDDNAPVVEPGLLSGKLSRYEKEIRQCIERLYLVNADRVPYIPGETVALAAIRRHIPANHCLVEYFIRDGELFVFLVTRQSIAVQALPFPGETILTLLENLYGNIAYALQEGSASPVTTNLTRLAQKISRKLYDLLIRPLLPSLSPQAGLIIIPFGMLHYIPFNILYNGRQYLAEEREITLLPSAALLGRPRQATLPGLVLLAFGDSRKLHHIGEEAALVGKIFESTVCSGQAATRDSLRRKPRQILHIAAHGRHRTDAPDFSSLELADGCLYADDLLQYDLGYELVTLSACETGRVDVKKSEELIGLIRGVLLAGAQAALVSLWCVDDAYTAELMSGFYTRLYAGKTKAMALREAECSLLAQHPQLHPAFWGAFQLVGTPGALQTCR